jgi:hypothetical protein
VCPFFSLELHNISPFFLRGLRAPGPVASLESRILRAITARDELAAIAIEASNADELHFTIAQFELLMDQLVALDEATRAITRAMKGALRRKWHKAHARAQILHKFLDKGV